MIFFALVAVPYSLSAMFFFLPLLRLSRERVHGADPRLPAGGNMGVLWTAAGG